VNFLVKTDPKDYFEKLFKILSLIIPLRPKEVKVMSSILLVHYMNRDKFEPEELGKLIFSKPTRVKMSESLGMTEGALNVTITELRKKGLIKKKIVSPDLVKFYPSDKPLEISYTLELK